MSTHYHRSILRRRSSSALAFGLAALLAPVVVTAQPAEPPPPPPASDEPADAAADSEADATDEPPRPAAPPPRDPNEPVELSKDPLADVLRAVPGGLTPDKVAERAVATSPSVAAKRAEVAAAAAKVDQALVAYLPIVTTSFTYTRLSEVENELDVGIEIPGMDMGGFSFPVILNSFSWDTTLAVPFSDYLFRLSQAYAAASNTEQAKRLEARAEALKAGADAKVAYLGWVRATGQRAVAELAVEALEAHVEDARITLEAGLLSRADLLALEARVAQAESLAQTAAVYQSLAAEQVRTTMHAPQATLLSVGIDVLGEPPPLDRRPLAELQRIALAQRLELRALAATKRSLEEAQAATVAGYFPRLDGFAGLTYANPNQRVFPQDEKWDWTWQIGLRASWTINDTFRTLGADEEMEANLRTLDRQRSALRDGIRLTVAKAYYDAAQARSTIAAQRRAEEAAVEALRVRRDRFRAGKATSTDIIDAENAVTQARFQRIDAQVKLLVAQAQLAYAMGEGASRVPGEFDR
ncbi:MAG: TolC family protein [Deltaproteobacteria bacterium]|jgi:outer membrane protein TolC|nr:TolC family protein [Deltaproteobacteria bacterium]MBW2536464.1 TolC family protein [Deltaproteobacteria bacterium]